MFSEFFGSRNHSKEPSDNGVQDDKGDHNKVCSLSLTLLEPCAICYLVVCQCISFKIYAIAHTTKSLTIYLFICFSSYSDHYTFHLNFNSLLARHPGGPILLSTILKSSGALILLLALMSRVDLEIVPLFLLMMLNLQPERPLEAGACQ